MFCILATVLQCKQILKGGGGIDPPLSFASDLKNNLPSYDGVHWVLGLFRDPAFPQKTSWSVFFGGICGYVGGGTVGTVGYLRPGVPRHVLYSI